MLHRIRIVLATSLLSVSLAASALAQTVPTVKEDQPGLLTLAKVTAAAATTAALGRVPGGAVKEVEIEREGGKLVYSFDIATPGKEGIDEVLVDALTGAVISVQHESAADEAKERHDDKGAKAATRRRRA